MERAITNPYFRKIAESGKTSRGKSASITGISTKIIFFLIMTAVGVFVSVAGLVPQEYELYMVIGSVGFSLISLLLSYLIPMTSPVTGTIFSVCEGYLIAWLCMQYSTVYNGIVPIALGVTFAVIVTMLFLYTTKIIKVNQKFRAVVGTLFLASILISLIVFASSFFTDALTSVFWGNGIIGIGISVLGVILASLHLAIDFDNISMCVHQKVDRKYEWAFAFGLVSTILMLFVRILELLSKIMPEND